MPYVNLPPGNSSLRFEDGSRAVAGRPGGRVQVTDAQAAAINSMGGNGTAGLVNGNPGEFFRARGKGRVCRQCSPNRRYFPFTEHCHRCGEATEPE